MKDKIAAFVCSGDLEVQERSSSALVLLECLKENPGLAQELIKTFEGELNPVAPKAQRKVSVHVLATSKYLLFCYCKIKRKYVHVSIYIHIYMMQIIYKFCHKNFIFFRFQYLRI